MVITLPMIYATPVVKSVQEQRESLPAIINFISSPKLTSVLAGAGVLLATANPLTAAATYFGTGALLGMAETSPKVSTYISQKITNPTGFGEDVGKVIESHPLEQAKQFLSEHKEEIAIGGIATAGLGASYLAYEKYLKTAEHGGLSKSEKKKIKQLQAQIEELTAKNMLPNIPPSVDTISGAGNEIPRTPTLPITPQTVYMDEKPSTTPQKTAQEGTGQKINQRVNVLVNQNQRIVKYKRGHRHHK